MSCRYTSLFRSGVASFSNSPLDIHQHNTQTSWSTLCFHRYRLQELHKHTHESTWVSVCWTTLLTACRFHPRFHVSPQTHCSCAGPEELRGTVTDSDSWMSIRREQHAKCSVQFVNAEYVHYYMMYFVVKFHIWHSISLYMFGWHICHHLFLQGHMRENNGGWNVMSVPNIRSTRGDIKRIFVVSKYIHKNTLLFYQINEDIYPYLYTFC